MPPSPETGTWQRLKRMPRRASEVLRDEGVRGLGSHVLGVLGDVVRYRRAVLLVRPLGDPIPTATARIPVEISLLKPSEIDEYVAFQPDITAAQARYRFDRGDKCFVARHQGIIVNASWSAEGAAWINYFERRLPLAPGEVYSYHNYTDPRYRGNNVPFVREVYLLRHFRDLGYRRLVAIVIPENKPAFASPEKSGYRRVGVIGYLKIGPWRYERMSAWHRRDQLE